MSQSTTTPPAPVVPIRPTSGAYPAPYWPSGPACPPDAFSAMARLMSCYEDVRLATEFLSKVMTDIIENNPAVTTAIVEAIQKAGSNLPTIGVTDGSNAQPGQVGEWVNLVQSVAYTAAAQTQVVTSGVLQPGDWNVFGFLAPDTWMTSMQFFLNPQPAGFSNNMMAISATPSGGTTLDAVALVSPIARASITAPTALVFTVITNAVGTYQAGTADFTINARRMR